MKPICLLLLTLLFTSCQNAGDQKLSLISLAPASSVNAKKVFKLDLKKSILKWEATAGHTGTIGFMEGNLAINSNDQIQSGDFTMDMNSIRSTNNQDSVGRRDLENHLKSDDFFSVPVYPKAWFAITSVLPGNNNESITINGNLTIKNITQPVVFKAQIVSESEIIKAKADFQINRTRWGINYEAGSTTDAFKAIIGPSQVKIGLNLVFTKD